MFHHKALFSVFVGLVIGMAGMAHATSAPPGIDIHVTPWVAPAFGSPSFMQAVAHEEEGLYLGMSSYGIPGTPAYFQAQSSASAAEIIQTDFPSWRGKADPGTVFGPAFVSEQGNGVRFGLFAVGHGMQFSVSQLSFSETSTDSGNALGLMVSGGYSYSPQFIGIRFGSDGVLGGSDDTLVTSGPSTQLVDALVGRGSGPSFATALCSPCTIAEQQAAIDAAAAFPSTPLDVSAQYAIATDTGTFAGSGTFHITAPPVPAVPEPATFALLGVGLLGIAAHRSLRQLKEI